MKKQFTTNILKPPVNIDISSKVGQSSLDDLKLPF